MTSKQKVVLLIASLLVIAWWNRFDTHCSGGDNVISCVAFDRMTGKWVLPIREGLRNYK